MNDPHLGAGHPAPALAQLGWSDALASSFASTAVPGDVAARVVAVHRSRIVVITEEGERDAVLENSLLSADPLDRPATGDWIVLHVDSTSVARARRVLPRRTAFIRRAAGERAVAQVVAANIDYVLIVAALPHDLNERRLERYLALAWESGAMPVVVLTKCDLVDAEELHASVTSVRATAPGVDVITVSATADDGILQLERMIPGGATIALLGSSGVGKSTLINRMAGREVMRTAGVDRDGRGRHTTTHRELARLPSGVLVIDTPGMRELQLWSADSGLDHVFEEIATLSESCRFADCRHEKEPGCAVSAAVSSGTLSPERVKSWRKLMREAARSVTQSDAVAASAERAKLRAMMRSVNTEVRARRKR